MSQVKEKKQNKKENFVVAEKEFEERVVTINHITKVVKGGRRYRFSAVVVVGDGKGTRSVCRRLLEQAFYFFRFSKA